MDQLLFLAAYAIIGVIAGFTAGLFGVGGGLIIVPALVLLFPIVGIESHYMQLAVGTSLATIVITASVSVFAHQKQGAIQWPLFWRLSPGIVVGVVAGAYFASRLASESLKIIFAVVEIIIAVRMMQQVQPSPSRQVPKRVVLSLVGSGIGMMSAIVGIGGGTITVPYLVWCNTALRKAIATSAACGLPIALIGSAAYIFFGFRQALNVPGSSGFIYWPAFFGIMTTSIWCTHYGASLTHRLPTQRLSKWFAYFLLLVGVYMLVS